MSLPTQTRQPAAAAPSTEAPLVSPSLAAPSQTPAGTQPPAPGTLRPQPHTPGVLEAFQSLLYLIITAIFIITFSLQPFRIPSGSMEPTLLIGDFLLVDKQGLGGDSAADPLPHNDIRRGEIVVFHYPVEPSIHLVKRVIGLPGERIRLRGGQVFINGTEIEEPYAVYRKGRADSYRDNFPRLQSPDPDVNSSWWMQMRGLVENGELLIPAGCYFVLGDNRNDSEDSRYWGFVPRSAIVGRPALVYFSLRETGRGTRPGVAGHVQPDKSGGLAGALFDLARWDRTLHIIR